jgi:hypothetical protein
MPVLHELNMCKCFCRTLNTFLFKLIIVTDQGQAVCEGRNYMIDYLYSYSIHQKHGGKKWHSTSPLPLNMGCVNYAEA